MTNEETMRIGEVTERTSLSLRTLRHWEDAGLVAPSARSEGNFRLYTEKDVERLLLIRRMKPLGYTLDEMRELLDIVDALAITPHDALLRAQLDDIRKAAALRREKLTEQLAMADEFVELLDRL